MSIYDPAPSEIAEAAAPPPEPGLLSRGLSGVLGVAGELAEGYNYMAGAVPRVGLGALLGAENTGTESTIAGTAPTGDDLLRALGLGALAGEKDLFSVGGHTFGVRPGRALELALDPAMWLGLGPIKAGKAAAQLSKAERFLKAAEATNRLSGPLKAAGIEEAEALVKALRARGVSPLAETLGERAAAGQTSALTAFGRPVPILGGRLASEAVLGPLGKLGGALGLGKTSDQLLMAEIGRQGKQVGLAREATGLAERSLIQAQVDALKSRAPELYDQLLRQVEPVVGEQQMGLVRENLAGRLTGRQTTRALAQLDPLADIPGFEPANRMLVEGIEQLGAARETPGAIRGMEEALAARQAPYRAQQAAAQAKLPAMLDELARLHDLATEGGLHPDEIANLQKEIQDVAGSQVAGLTGSVKGKIANLETKIERLRTRAAGQIAVQAAKGKVGEAYVAALPAELRAEAERILALHGEVLSMEQGFAGVPTPKLGDPIGYLERIVTPEAIAEEARLGRPDSPWNRYFRVLDVRGPFTEMRTPELRGYTRSQIQAKWLAEGHKSQLFVENVSDAVAKRIIGGGKSMGVAVVGQGAVRAFHAPKGSIPDGMDMAEFLSKYRITRVGDVELSLLPKELRELGIEAPELASRATTPAQIREALKGTVYENTVLPKQYADELLKVRQLVDQPEELKKIAQGLNRYLAVLRYSVTAMGFPVPKVGFGVGAAAGGIAGGALGGPLGAIAGAGIGGMAGKFGALALFPAYDIRNVLSNGFMMWLAGMHNPSDLRDIIWAWKTQNKYAKALADPINGRRILETDKDIAILRLAQEVGAQGGQVTGETAIQSSEAFRGQTGLLGRLGERLANPLKSQTAQRSIERSVFLENNSKLALFRNRLRNGIAPQEAGNIVRKYLFDYTEVGPIDKEIRKWMYFWTYARKAYPLMLQELFLNPRKMALWAYGTGLLGSSDERALLRNYQFAQNPIPGGTTEDGQRVFWDVGLPPAYLTQISSEGEPGWAGARNLAGNVLGMLAPHVRGPFEFATGRSVSTGQPVTANQALLGMTPASRIMSSLRTIGQIQSGKKPPLAGWGLVGARPILINPQTAPLQKKLDEFNAWRDNQVMLGNLRRSEDAYAPKDMPGREGLLGTLKFGNRLREELRKMREGQ